MDAVAVARIEARIVVVVEDQQRRVAVELRLQRRSDLARKVATSSLLMKPTWVSIGSWNSGLIGRAVLLCQLGDVGQIGFADEDTRAGEFIGVEFVRVGAHLLHHGWTPGRLLVRVSLRAMSP